MRVLAVRLCFHGEQGFGTRVTGRENSWLLSAFGRWVLWGLVRWKLNEQRFVVIDSDETSPKISAGQVNGSCFWPLCLEHPSGQCPVSVQYNIGFFLAIDNICLLLFTKLSTTVLLGSYRAHLREALAVPDSEIFRRYFFPSDYWVDKDFSTSFRGR